MTVENTLEAYWRALDRVIRGCPNVVPKDSKITNDLVSLEAGKKKGSIKKSREQFTDLIVAINEAALEQEQSLNKQKYTLQRLKDETKDLRSQLDEALGRELSLLLELFEMKKKLSSLTGDKIIPIRSNTK